MSKNKLKRATKLNRVQAVFTRFKRDMNGEITRVGLYDIFAPEYLKR